MKHLLPVLILVLLITSIGGSAFAQDRIEVSVWFHGGTADESAVTNEQIARFNESQEMYTALLTEIPGGAVAGSGYNDAVNAAAVAGDLPCVLDLDGPFLYNYAWAGFLAQLDDYMSDDLRADYLPSLMEQGTYNDHIYALGQYDSGLALVGRVSLLEEAGVRIPTGIDDPWTLEEFNEVLEKLAALDSIEYAIDLKMNYGAGEWFTYSFSPVLQSFGADLINREDYQSAEGILNGETAVEAMTWVASLFENGYTTLTPPDDNEFVNGKAALGFAGHWVTKAYFDAFGDDVVLIPLVDFGNGAATGMGSWAWAVTESCEQKDGAWAFLEFLLEPEEMIAMTAINSAVPGRLSVLAESDLYGEGGRLHVFAQQLSNGVAVPRPITPAYPTITSAFYTAMDNILKGGDVQDELDLAVDKIDEDIAANDGYPVME